MKEKFSEEYNLVLQLNHRKKLIYTEMFTNFKKKYQTIHNLLLKEHLKIDIYDLIEPSTFKEIIEDYYDEQRLIADTVHDLTDPSTFEKSIEEYYEIQKRIIDNTRDFPDTDGFNEKDIGKTIQSLIDPLYFEDQNYARQIEEERIFRTTEKIFSHPFIEKINRIFNKVSLSDGKIKIAVNSDVILSIPREELYAVYKNLKDQSEYSKIEKIEIVCIFCIIRELSTVYYVLANKTFVDLEKVITEVQVLIHYYIKNLSPKVFYFFDDPKKRELLMPRAAAPLLFWFLLKFIIRNFPKWG